MASPIVQFDNVRKHYQMGLVTVECLRGVSSSIASASALLARFDGRLIC